MANFDVNCRKLSSSIALIFLKSVPICIQRSVAKNNLLYHVIFLLLSERRKNSVQNDFIACFVLETAGVNLLFFKIINLFSHDKKTLTQEKTSIERLTKYKIFLFSKNLIHMISGIQKLEDFSTK